MAAAGIKRGQKLRQHAANTMLKACNLIINADVRALAHNAKFPNDQQTLFSDAAGIEEALDLLMTRAINMKNGNILPDPSVDV